MALSIREFGIFWTLLLSILKRITYTVHLAWLTSYVRLANPHIDFVAVILFQYNFNPLFYFILLLLMFTWNWRFTFLSAICFSHYIFDSQLEMQLNTHILCYTFPSKCLPFIDKQINQWCIVNCFWLVEVFITLSCWYSGTLRSQLISD